MGPLVKELEGVCPDRIVKIRKAHHLGPNLFSALRNHCRMYGVVDDVHALQQPPARRSRPSSLAFVIMRDGSGAAALLAAGSEQFVMGTKVLVEPYEHRCLDISDTRSPASATMDCPITVDRCIGSAQSADDAISVVTIEEEVDDDYWPTDDEWS